MRRSREPSVAEPAVAPAPSGSHPVGGGPTATSAAPRRVREQVLPRRRNTRALVVGIAVAAVGAAGCLLVVSTVGDKASVIILTRDVPFGTRLTNADLAVTKAALDPAVRSMPATALPAVLGQRTSGYLHSGSLLTDDEIAVGVEVPAGKALVGLSLGSGQLPGRDLTPGAPLSLVIVPDSAAAASSDAGSTDPAPTPTTAPGTGTTGSVQKVVTGTLEAVGDPSDDGRTPVDVLVNSADSPDLAAAAAAQRVVLVALPVQ